MDNRIKNACGHIVMGWFLMLRAVPTTLVSILVLSAIDLYGWRAIALPVLVIAYLRQCDYWLGREVRDHEIEEKKAGRDIAHGVVALKGLRFWRWNKDGRKDWLAPVVVNGAATAALVILLGRVL